MGHYQKINSPGIRKKKRKFKNGLLVRNSRFVTADSLEIKDFQKSGLFVDLSGDITLNHIFAHENGFAGISVGGSGVSKKSNHHIYIGYCRAENNPGDPSNLTTTVVMA